MDTLNHFADVANFVNVIALLIIEAIVPLSSILISKKYFGLSFVAAVVVGGVVSVLMFGLVAGLAYLIPPAGTPEPRTPVTQAEVRAIIAADLRHLPEADREDRRYLVLTHLHNNPAVSDADLASVRDRLRDLAAYLSPAGTVVTFRPVDDANIVYTLDGSDFGRPASEAWPEVLTAYPYAVTPSADAGSEAAAIAEMTGSPLAYVRADWLVQAAVRPPLGREGGLFHRPGAVPDPLRTFAQQYDEQRVSAELAAWELGAVSPEQVAAEVQAEAYLRDQFRLAPLADGGTIGRDVWESREFITSPFQELSRALKLGTPLQVD